MKSNTTSNCGEVAWRVGYTLWLSAKDTSLYTLPLAVISSVVTDGTVLQKILAVSLIFLGVCIVYTTVILSLCALKWRVGHCGRPQDRAAFVSDINDASFL